MLQANVSTANVSPAASTSAVRPFWKNGLVVGLLAAVVHGAPWLVDVGAWCGWLAIALGLVAVTRPGATGSLWATWLWCTLAIAIAFHWSPEAMAYTLSSDYWLGLVVASPLVAWDGLRLATGYWLGARITRNLALVWLPAALWTVAIELFIPSVFPWRLGFMQLTWPWLIQAVDVFGAGWSTIVAFAHAGLLLLLWQTFRRVPFTPWLKFSWAACGGLLVSNAIYCATAWNRWGEQIREAPQIKVALVQVDPSFVESTDRARQLTESVASQVQIVCWPESSGGTYDLELNDLSDQQTVFAHSREPERGLQPWTRPTCELVLGGKSFSGSIEEPDRLHVSAMLIDPAQHIAFRYHKRYLMPFGEYVPFEQTIPGMAELFDMAEHVEPGSHAEPICSQTGARIGAMLCYEDMVPTAAIDMTRSGANLLVSLANGSAFSSPYTLKQHRLLSQLRAVECRKTMLRCAATGETCAIDARGTITDRLPLQQDSVLVTTAPLLEGDTLYVRFPWLGTGLIVAGLFAAVIVRWRSAGQRPTKASG